MNCFTRKANRFTRKSVPIYKCDKNTTIFECIVLRVKSIVLRVKTRVLRVKHYINDPFSHNLQTTLTNVTTFDA